MPKKGYTMNIDTQDKLSAQINQARGVLAALLADTCDLKRGPKPVNRDAEQRAMGGRFAVSASAGRDRLW
tara:strand:+ start:195 stop:404 length:210 start_codon:yes stop_codon:yes gene_type:complete